MGLSIKSVPALPAQTAFFARLRGHLPAHLSLVDEVADVLQLSSDSTYRRLRGETALSLDEATRLAQHFQLPLTDLLASPRESVTFQRMSINAQPGGIGDYLRYTASYFGQAAAANAHISYAAKDIPAIYHFLFPELARFKVFFWLKTIKTVAAFSNLRYAAQHIPDDVLAAGAAAAEQYLRMPTVEIWNDETVNSTLRQIEYYHDAGLYEQPADVPRLLDALEALVQHIQRQAVTGRTLRHNLEVAPYQLYFNEILLLDNTILTAAEGHDRVLVSYNGMDYLHTTDASFCTEVKQWMRVQTEKSTLISQVSEKERNRFFNKIYARIEEQRRKLR